MDFNLIIWKSRHYATLLKYLAKGSQYPKGFDENRCIFTHIPKAAGISVCLTFFGEEVGHIPLRIYKYKSKTKFAEYYKFTFVRNPWARLVSAYFFLKQGGLSHHPWDKKFSDAVLSQYDSFGSFVKGWLNHNNVYKYIHFFPQSYFICNRQRQSMCDFIGRFENVERDFHIICQELCLDSALPHYNKGGEYIDYRHHYDANLINKVKDIYKDDVDLFEYDF
jgi:hypothetical protein